MKKEQQTDQIINGYKGFDKNLKCRDFQFKEGEEFVHIGEVKACNSGFHFCENPLDVFKYYPLKDGNVFHKVEGYGKHHKENSDSKVSVEKIKIGLKLSFKDIVKASIDFVFEKIKKSENKEQTSGYYSTSATSGYYSTSATSGYYSTSATSGYSSTSATSGYSSTSATSGYSSTSATSGNSSTSATSGNSSTSATSGNYSTSATSGDYSTSATSGYYSTSATSGYYSTSATSGYYSTSATSGYSSTSATSGYSSTSATSGDSSTSATSGYYSTSATSGDSSTSIVNGKNSIAVSNGINCKAKGKKGNWIVLPEYVDGNISIVKTALIDGKTIKEDTLYILKNGEFVEYE